MPRSIVPPNLQRDSAVYATDQLFDNLCDAAKVPASFITPTLLRLRDSKLADPDYDEVLDHTRELVRSTLSAWLDMLTLLLKQTSQVFLDKSLIPISFVDSKEQALLLVAAKQVLLDETALRDFLERTARELFSGKAATVEIPGGIVITKNASDGYPFIAHSNKTASSEDTAKPKTPNDDTIELTRILLATIQAHKGGRPEQLPALSTAQRTELRLYLTEALTTKRLQDRLPNVLGALGLDPIPQSMTSDDIDVLLLSVEEALNALEFFDRMRG